jgi:hypothetical protein
MAAGGWPVAASARGDEDRFLTVRSREHVRIIRAWGYLGNILNLGSRLTKRVHYLALDAFVLEVSHSSAFGEDHIKAKDVDSVLVRRQHNLPSQRWIGTQYLVDGLAAREFLENQLDGDAGSLGIFDEG